MPAELKEIKNCPVCSSANYEISFTLDKYTGRQCVNCGLVFISPVSTDSAALYTDDQGSSPSRYYEQASDTDKETFSKRLDLIAGFTEKGAILDIGCSTGTFMKTAIEKTWQYVCGVEPNPASAAICRKNDLNVLEGFFNKDSAQKLDRDFNAVHLGDIIEHTADPAGMLDLVRSKLKDEGCIFIVTPNYESYAARKFQIKPEEHLLYFTEGSLKYLLNKCGLEVVFFKKTTRKRTFRALRHSTTFRNKPVIRFLLNVFYIPRLSSVSNFLLNLLVSDELLVIARKEPK